MGNLVKKKICRCEHCGNEAEMQISCTLPVAEEAVSAKAADSNPPSRPSPQKVRGIGTCSHCGNEADMWVEL